MSAGDDCLEDVKRDFAKSIFIKYFLVFGLIFLEVEYFINLVDL